MVSDRIQRQIDRLLDQAEEAMGRLEWEVVRQRSRAVLSLHPDHADALTYLAAAAKALGEPEVAAAPISARRYAARSMRSRGARASTR